MAERRLAEARRLADAQQALLRADAEAEQLRSVADQDAGVAVERAAERDAAAVSLALAWRRWAADARTRELFGEITWAAHPAVRPLLLDAEALTEPAEGRCGGWMTRRWEAARPAQATIEAERLASTHPTRPAMNLR